MQFEAIKYVEVCNVKLGQLYAYCGLPLAAVWFTWGGGVELQEAAEVAECCTRAYGTVAACWKLLGDIEVYWTCCNWRLFPLCPTI